MLKNYLKVAFRNLLRQKGYTAINIIGLSVGLASALIIFMFVYEELNYDKFYKNARNIYRVYLKANLESSAIINASTPAPLAAALKNDYPEVKLIVRMQSDQNSMVSIGDKYFMVQHNLYVDSTFFEIFDLPLLRGDPEKVLAEPRTVVLTETLANKLFGKDDPINKMIKIENDTSYYRVTGLMKDPPHNTHFEFEMLVSFHSLERAKSNFWLSNSYSTYILLPENFPYRELEKKFPDMVKKYCGPQIKEIIGVSIEDFAKKGNTYGYLLQPLPDIHLNTEIGHDMKPSNNKKYLYIFSIIGLFIFIIACINFMNLSTARSINRAIEVGMRKVLGSERGKLIGQFLSESILVSIISMLISVLVLGFVLPYINNALQLNLGFNIFKGWQIAASMLAFAILIGILAGLYPAFVLSSFHPTTILKDKLKSGSKGSLMRSLLVVLQFFIAIFILTGTAVVYKQLKYMQNKDLGFNKSKLLVMERAGALKEKLPVFIEEMKKLPEVVNATSSTSIPGFPNENDGFLIEGREASKTYLLAVNWVDANYQPTYQFTMTEGRFFSPDMPTDSSAVIINQTAVRKFDLKNPVGIRFMKPGQEGKFQYLTVIGVVKDFHFTSLHSAIDPYIMILKPKKSNYGGYISVRLGSGDINKSVRKVEDLWKQFTTGQPIQYSFLDDKLMTLYKEEKRTGTLSITFTILAVLIACLGLLGLISYSSVQRTKEIGIRKIMGASVPGIVVLLSAEITKLIIISSLFAWPLAYLFLKGWLADFAYRVGLNPVIFLITTLIIFLLSLLTIGYQAIYSATRNPADSLRYE